MEFKLSSELAVLWLSLLNWGIVGCCSLSKALPENDTQFLLKSCTWWFAGWCNWCNALRVVGILPRWKFMSVSDTKGCGMSFRPSTSMGDTKASLLFDELTTGLVCSTLLLLLFLGCLGVFGVVGVDGATKLFFLSKECWPLGKPPLGQENWKPAASLCWWVDWGGTGADTVAGTVDDNLPWPE